MQRGLVGSEMCIRDRYMGANLLAFLFYTDGEKILDYPQLQQSAPELRKLGIDSICKEIDSLMNLIQGNDKSISLPQSAFTGLYYLSALDYCCLLYTSDAADDTPCVDLGGRRIIKKKKKERGNKA
eukprot:TRINITY_DN45466_c0_g1_i1.p1 TRINITY_DN45466_c0_g1~~TRINITY_DN45466_c0_g1_i1.p1  ORF type:complete len:126 (-),score=39.63 TRINITY_DN45466_c0_g1_i1:74-451(-)